MKKSRRIFISTVCIILAALFVLSITAMVFSTAAHAASSSQIQEEINDLKSQKSDIEDQIAAYQEQIESLDYQKASVVEKKTILDQKNALAQEELNIIQEQIDIIDNLITNQQQDLEKAHQNEEYQRERFLERVRSMEENSTLSYIQVIFNSTSFSDLLTRMDLVNEVMEYDTDLVADYLAARENVEYLEAQAEEMFATNEANKAELEVKKAELEASIAAASQMIADLEADIDGYNEMMAAEEAAAAEIEQMLAEKADELAEAKAAEYAALLAAQAAAAASSSSGGDATSSGSSGSAATVTSDVSFLWPSYCRTITSYYGNRLHPVYGYYKFHSGVDIGASSGTSIWAAASGTVSASSYDSGYGNYVMVTHSNGYTTLYAHMSSRAVSYGQSVSQGQILGYVGSTGVSTGPHIHFEVRLTSTGGTLDPTGFGYVYS